MVYGIVVAIIFGCYVLSSLILFKFPWLLHKRKDVKFVCRHISHRGGAGENYENTMTAFKHAVSLGTEMLELDVHLTRDEQVVVAHDPDLRRTDVACGNIADLNYSELPPLKESVTVDFMPGCTFSRPSEPDRRMPLLETVFQNFPHTPINIDIKVPNDLLIIKVSELVRRYKREHLTVWGNFSDAITQRCYRENPNICLLFSLKRVLLLVLQLYSGLLPFMPLKETHLEIFMPRHLYKLYLLKAPAMDPAEAKRPGSPLHSVSNLNFGRPHSSADVSPSHSSALMPSSSSSPGGAAAPKGPWYLRTVASVAHTLLIRPALFAHLARRGIQTYLWVLNSEEEYHQAFKSGATGVMTDYPSKLKAFLADNPQYLHNFPEPPTPPQQPPCDAGSCSSGSHGSLSDEGDSWAQAEAASTAGRRSNKSVVRADDDMVAVRSLSPSFASATSQPQLLVAEGL